jgi:hypothetical protein
MYGVSMCGIGCRDPPFAVSSSLTLFDRMFPFGRWTRLFKKWAGFHVRPLTNHEALPPIFL